MTSSGTYAYAPSIGELTLSAFERIQLRLPSLRQEHFRTARNEVNLMQASMSNLQPNLWKVETGSINLVSGTATYSIDARTVMILDAYLSLNNGLSTQTDRYITPISRSEYASYAAKFTSGQPTTYWFDRLISPTLTTWPVADATSTYVINYYACVQIQDASLTNGQTPDIPYLWLDAYVAGLAHRLARVYAPALEQLRMKDAKDAWDVAAAQNTEYVPFKIAPSIGRYYPGRS